MSDPDHGDSYALEIQLMLLFFDLRLGFNPWFLWYDGYLKPRPVPEDEPVPED